MAGAPPSSSRGFSSSRDSLHSPTRLVRVPLCPKFLCSEAETDRTLYLSRLQEVGHQLHVVRRAASLPDDKRIQKAARARVGRNHPRQSTACIFRTRYSMLPFSAAAVHVLAPRTNTPDPDRWTLGPCPEPREEAAVSCPLAAQDSSKVTLQDVAVPEPTNHY